METTLTLRNRLGFNEVTLWKQFCSRRLHLIHTLSLSLRKASEQEEQVRVLAAELCAEYGFDPSAQSDFEKLLIAGIQSVRRNQKRSARNPSSGHRVSPPGTAQGSPAGTLRTPTLNGINGGTHGGAHGGIATNPHNTSTGQGSSTTQGGSEAAVGGNASNPTYSTRRARSSSPLLTTPRSLSNTPLPNGSVNSHYGDTIAPITQAPTSISHHHSTTTTSASLAARLDVLRSMVGAGSAMWIESHAPEIAQASASGALSTAVATAAVHAKLSREEAQQMRESITGGPLLEALRLALDRQLTVTRLMERLGALGASLVHGPHLLSALQALCVCLAQAASGDVSEMCRLLAPETQASPVVVQRSEQQALVAHEHANDLLPYAISRNSTPRVPEPPMQEPLFNVPDRFVTLEYNGRSLRMTYSPMKASPPTLSEIIETGRVMFEIPSTTVARVKDLQSRKIIETNSELIDAFSQQQVRLELFLPPPMLAPLPSARRSPARFTPLAPIFRTST